MLLIYFKKFSDIINIRNKQTKIKVLILTIIYWWITYWS